MTATGTTPSDIQATVKSLRKWARTISPAMKQSVHFQIAKRRISDAAMFAERNTEHAEKCCWEARFHLQQCEG